MNLSKLCPVINSETGLNITNLDNLNLAKYKCYELWQKSGIKFNTNSGSKVISFEAIKEFVKKTTN